MEEYINRRCYSYSLGMKQKLALVIVLSKKSDIILLDEPTLSLDADSVNVLIEIVKELSQTKKIIFSTHDLQSLSHIFEDIIYVKNQRLDILEKKTFNSTSFIVRVRDYKLFQEKFKSAEFKKNSDNEFVVMIENNKIDLTIKEFTDYGLLKLVCLTNDYGVK
jgi:ABC-type multidrug transport system ATPase subunit